MIAPKNILDLIEAIEVSAEKRNYELSTKQRILISKLKVKAEKDMWVSNNYWELLCDMFNEVEGRKNHFLAEMTKAMQEEAYRDSSAVICYIFIPFIILVTVIGVISAVIWGFRL